MDTNQMITFGSEFDAQIRRAAFDAVRKAASDLSYDYVLCGLPLEHTKSLAKVLSILEDIAASDEKQGWR